jgi:hypothetical protein
MASAACSGVVRPVPSRLEPAARQADETAIARIQRSSSDSLPTAGRMDPESSKAIIVTPKFPRRFHRTASGAKSSIRCCKKHWGCHGRVTRLSINPITDAILPSLNAGAVNGEKISTQLRNGRRRHTQRNRRQRNLLGIWRQRHHFRPRRKRCCVRRARQRCAGWRSGQGSPLRRRRQRFIARRSGQGRDGRRPRQRYLPHPPRHGRGRHRGPAGRRPHRHSATSISRRFRLSSTLRTRPRATSSSISAAAISW